MGACREGFNLFNKYQRANFWAKKNKPWRLMLGDTLMPLICMVRGHDPYRPDKIIEPREWACKRCHKWLDLDGKV
jgi:hypothetical protein